MAPPVLWGPHDGVVGGSIVSPKGSVVWQPYIPSPGGHVSMCYISGGETWWQERRHTCYTSHLASDEDSWKWFPPLWHLKLSLGEPFLGTWWTFKMRGCISKALFGALVLKPLLFFALDFVILLGQSAQAVMYIPFSVLSLFTMTPVKLLGRSGQVSEEIWVLGLLHLIWCVYSVGQDCKDTSGLLYLP